jgi:hypothetical protein
MRYRLRTLLICLTVVALVLGLIVEGAYRLRREQHYSVEIWPATPPPDDWELVWWLRDQPGVVSQSALHFDDHVILEFAMRRDLLGRPKFPEFEQALPSLGYKEVLQFDMQPAKEYHRRTPGRPPPVNVARR